MKRSELIRIIAQDMGITFTAAQKFIRCLEKNVTNILVEGENISLLNFGCLKTRSQSARWGRNPKTGEPVMMVPRTTVYFKPGKLLLDTLNKQK